MKIIYQETGNNDAMEYAPGCLILANAKLTLSLYASGNLNPLNIIQKGSPL